MQPMGCNVWGRRWGKKRNIGGATYGVQPMGAATGKNGTRGVPPTENQGYPQQKKQAPSRLRQLVLPLHVLRREQDSQLQ